MDLSFLLEGEDSKKINSIILDALLKKIIALIVFMKIYVYQTVFWLVLLMSQLLAVILHTEKATSSGKFPFAPAHDKNLSVEEFPPTPFFLQVGHIASFLDFFKMRISRKCYGKIDALVTLDSPWFLLWIYRPQKHNI